MASDEMMDPKQEQLRQRLAALIERKGAATMMGAAMLAYQLGRADAFLESARRVIERIEDDNAH